jgi:hypothetical protein
MALHINSIDELQGFLTAEGGTIDIMFNSTDPKQFEFVGVDLNKLLQVLVIKAGNRETFLQDMSLLVVVSQVRGTNLRMLERMPNTGKLVLQSVINRYGVVAHKRNTPVENPTLPRILSLVPQMIYNFRLKHPSKVRTWPPITNGLPGALAFPGGCAMIKTTSTLDQWVAWYTDFCTQSKMNPMPTRDQMLLAHRFSKVDADSKI